MRTGELRMVVHESRRHAKPTLAEQFAWAEKYVPDECPNFVVGAAQMLAYNREPVTPAAVRRRLVARGRTKAQIVALEKELAERGAA